METICVYRHELYDASSRGFVRQLRYATETAITGMSGIVMYSTLREVPASEVDGGGIWSPPVICVKNDAQLA